MLTHSAMNHNRIAQVFALHIYRALFSLKISSAAHGTFLFRNAWGKDSVSGVCLCWRVTMWSYYYRRNVLPPGPQVVR